MFNKKAAGGPDKGQTKLPFAPLPKADAAKPQQPEQRSLPWPAKSSAPAQSQSTQRAASFSSAASSSFKSSASASAAASGWVSASKPADAGKKRKYTDEHDDYGGYGSDRRENSRGYGGGRYGSQGGSSGYGTQQSGGVSKAQAADDANLAAILKLSDEQKEVLGYVSEHRENVFFTGAAGTGKSFLLKQIIKDLKRLHGKEAVAVCASTGLAAVNISGVTLHAWAGVGLATEPAPLLAGKIRKNKNALSRWSRTQVLIVDEISMVDATLFDKLEEVARDIKRNSRPFGGIQVILTGDFYQLPPVDQKGASFAFEAKSWARVVTKQIELKKVFRQTDDTFVKLLNELRVGRCSDETRRVLKSLERTPSYPKDGIEPTQLYSRRQEVEQANNAKLVALPGEMRKYTATDTGNPEHVKKLDSSCMAPLTLLLKVNAQVVLIKSMETGLGMVGLVNGSRGVVVGFSDKTGLPIVRFTNGKELEIEKQEFSQESSGEKLATRRQVPLLLAWALSIHKSQGQTIDRLKVDLGSVFEKGQTYVAISRARSMQGLQVLRFESSKVMAHPKVVEWERRMREAASKKSSGQEEDGFF